MIKIINILSFFVFLVLTACGGSHIYVDEVGFDDFSYYGDDLAGLSYSATHVELGIGSGNIYSVDPGSLQISFDISASYVLGNKNCNAFEAETLWYEFGLAFRFSAIENQFCPIDLVGFPEDVYLDDVFEVETYVDLGRQVLVLYSENQDVAIYLE